MQPPIPPPLSAFGFPLSPTPPAPDTTIVIPQYGHSHLTTTCVHSLRQHEPTPWPILIIDDGSPAADIDPLRDHSPAHTRIITRPHQGVTAAWNHAAHNIHTTWIVFLNNDVQFRGPLITHLLQPLITRQALISGVAWRTESALPADLLHALPTRRLLQGWCFAINRELLHQLGGFDTTLHTWFSDTDLQLRLIEAAGTAHIDAPLFCHPTPHITHHGRATTRHTPNRSVLWRTDRNTFVRKWRHRLNIPH